MGLRPLILSAEEILSVPALKEKYGTRADAWLKLAGQIFEKWDARGCWREVKAGGLWVVPGFGMDAKTGGWTEGYARRRLMVFQILTTSKTILPAGCSPCTT